ncbi:MAG TPA: peptide deformylase [Gemmatimonadetes bacterium]|jgi:peptide deformylase|nr:peptide deformylase [Gemmatimonadota bacterium]
MAVRQIVVMGDPILRTATAEVDAFDRDLKMLVRDLFETMYHAEGIGLAAPQIGISRRVIVIDLRSEEQPEARLALINPSVVWASAESDKEPEGCLSIPGLEEVIKRSLAIRVEAVDIDGGRMELEAEGLFARVLQHEMDHLDGILFVDRVSALKRRILMKKWKKIQAEED